MQTPVAPDPAPAPPPDALPRRWRSEELLQGAAEVLIDHEAQVYRLRRTAQGKLILTK